MLANNSLRRVDIAKAIQYEVGLSRSKSQAVVEAIVRHMTAALEQGNNVKLSGFGTFMLRDKAERTGRNPKTGACATITPRRVLTFRPSPLVKARVTKK